MKHAAPHFSYALPAFALLGLSMVAMMVLLALPIALPVGSMYWDSNIYIDASYRIGLGQIPSVDFFAPVGALGYYLTHWTFALFPQAQPVLAASWSIAPITFCAMALICWQASRNGPWLALALVVPFLVFAVLPFNTTPAYPFPGSDGFAIYNRQTSQLLYCLVAAFLFTRHQATLALLVAALMSALFFIKITGFVSAGLICVIALISGRITWQAALASAAGFVIVCAASELWTSGMVTAYVTDIVTLIAINTDGFMPRMLQSISRTFGTTLAAVALCLALIIATWPSLTRALRQWDFSAIVDHPTKWIGVVLFAGLFFESQNTGGQEIIFLWPVIIMIAARIELPGPNKAVTALTLTLCAASVLPMTMATLQAAARASAGALKQIAIPNQNLGTMGHVTTRAELLERTSAIRQTYASNPQVLRALADADQMPSFVLFSEHDFQTLYLTVVDDTVTALKAHAQNGLSYETIMPLNFTNPFAALLGKTPPKHISIGAVADRSVPPMDQQTRQALSETDIVLIPLCPYTAGTKALADLYGSALSSHRRVKISQCHDALVHERISYDFGG